MSLDAVLVVLCGPNLPVGLSGGNCSAAPELFRRLSLLFSADSVDCVPSRAAVELISALPTLGWEADGVVPGEARKPDLRFGGDVVDIVVLKVTFRVGLGGVGRGEEVSLVDPGGRRGEDSEAPAPVDDAIMLWE